MSRHSFSRLFAFWTRRSPLRSSSGARAWPEIPVRLSMEPPGTARARFTPEQLDELCGLVLSDLDDTRFDRAPRRSEVAASAGRSGPSVQAVDRAIAELASPRGRRKRARW